MRELSYLAAVILIICMAVGFLGYLTSDGVISKTKSAIVTVKKILNISMLTIHFAAGAFTLFCILFLLRKEYFFDLALYPALTYFGSGILIFFLFYIKGAGWERMYFGTLTAITLVYVGLWTFLGIVMINGH